MQTGCNDAAALNKCLLEEMKGIAIPKGCSHLPAGLRLLQGFGGHFWAKEKQGWEGPCREDTLLCCSEPQIVSLGCQSGVALVTQDNSVGPCELQSSPRIS